MTQLNQLFVFKDARKTECARDRAPAETHADQLPLAYLRARERAERAAVKNARSDAARHIHQQLASEYAARIRQTRA